MQTKPIISEIEEFFENGKYRLKIEARENYQGSQNGHLLTLKTSFYPGKELVKKTSEFDKVFKEYCSQLGIKYKQTFSCKKTYTQEYIVDKAIIKLGYNMQNKSYFLMFACHGKQPKVLQKEVDKLKELFKKFRDLLEYEGCKSKRLDIIVDKLSKHWLKKNREGLRPSEKLDSFLKEKPKLCKINTRFVDDLVAECTTAEMVFERDNFNKAKKEPFELLEKVKDITKPISLLLNKRVVLSEECGEKFLSWCEGKLKEYKPVRDELLKRINTDFKQEEIKKYKEDYVEVISGLHHAKNKKEKQGLIKIARKIAAKFDYNPEKDLAKYL